jgi:hypothetical protein
VTDRKLRQSMTKCERLDEKKSLHHRYSSSIEYYIIYYL